MIDTKRTAAAAAVLLLSAAACSSEDADASAASAEDGTVVIEMGDMYFAPDRVEVPAGEEITFELVNEGGAEHDLTFEDGTASPSVPGGDTATFTAGPFDADTVAWCDVPGHRGSGMELEVVVVD